MPQFIQPKIRVSALAFCLFTSSFCFAEGEPLDDFEDEIADFYGDEDFISLATGNTKSIHRAPAVASVISAEDIANMGVTKLTEVLERVPGLHVSLSSLSRFDPVFVVRGIQSSSNAHILVLLNGKPFKNAINGGLPYMFNLPVHNISRLEIIRGPGSAIYGADAFSGVINIIMGDLAEDSLNFGVSKGSFNSTEFWLKGNNKFDEISVSYSIDTNRTDGDDSRIAESDLQTILDGIFLTDVSLSPSAFATDTENLSANLAISFRNFNYEAWYWDQDQVGLGPGGAQALDHTGYQDGELFTNNIDYSVDFDESTNLKLAINHQKYKQDSFFVLFPAGTVLPIAADGNLSFTDIVGFTNFSDGYIGRPMTVNTDIRTSAILTSKALSEHDVRFEIGKVTQKLNTSEFKNFGPGVLNGTQLIVPGELTDVSNSENVFIQDTERDITYFSIQDEWVLSNDWELTYGIRYDDYSDFGSTVNPRAALVWQTRYNLTSKLLFGKAFRPPSFTELHLRNNPVSLGNDSLQPETIDTLELAFDYRQDANTKLTFSIFAYQAKDIIEVVDDVNATTRSYQNTRDQKGNGLEITYEQNFFDGFDLSANVSLQDSQAKPTFGIVEGVYNSVADVPGNSAYVQLDYDISDYIFTSLQTRWINDRQRSSGDLREKIRDYSNSNFVLGVNLQSLPIRVKFMAKNIFNQNQYEPSDGTIMNDYALEQRSYWLEISITL